MAIDSTPTPPPRPLGRRSFRGTSPPLANAGDRLFRLQILCAAKPSRSSKLDPRTGKTISSDDIRRVYAPTPVVPCAVDARKSKSLVFLDATLDSAHHRSSQNHLQLASVHSRDDLGARSPVVFPKKEPDEDCVRLPPRPLAAAPIARRRLLGNAGADNLQLPIASRSGGDHRSSQFHHQRTFGHSRGDARARSPVILPKREPDEDRARFPLRPLAATPIARRRLLVDAGADNLQLPLASTSGGNIITRGGVAEALGAAESEPHVLHDTTAHTTYRVISRHRFTWYARPRRGDTPETVIKNEPEEDFTPLIARSPNVASASQLPLNDATRSHNLEATARPKPDEGIAYLTNVDPSLKYGEMVSRDGDAELPPLVVSRGQTTNRGTTEAPTASINRPRVPSLSTVTQHTSTMDSFSAMFPWARYSVELNRPINAPLRSSPPPAVRVKREPTPVLLTDEEDFDTSNEASDSESELAESDRGSKRTRDKASNDSDETAEVEEVEVQRPQRRRKLLWVD